METGANRGVWTWGDRVRTLESDSAGEGFKDREGLVVFDAEHFCRARILGRMK